MPNLNTGILSSIPFGPEKQNKKIANVLSAVEKIELNNRINAELEAMAKPCTTTGLYSSTSPMPTENPTKPPAAKWSTTTP